MYYKNVKNTSKNIKPVKNEPKNVVVTTYRELETEIHL